jgi:hypothetical protein
VQLGFVNYADSIEYGVPIGFISIVRKGGYHAVEYSFSEFFPVNAGLKLGVDKLYTTIFTSFNFAEGSSPVAIGLGAGSIIPIGKFFFFNPEFSVLSSVKWQNYHSFLTFNAESFVPYIGFKFGKHLSITAGPSITWVQTYNEADIKKQLKGMSANISDWEVSNTPVEMPKPLFSIYSYDINENNRMVIGARAAVRLQL